MKILFLISALYWFVLFVMFLFGYTPDPWTIGLALFQSAFFFVIQALDIR